MKQRTRMMPRWVHALGAVFLVIGAEWAFGCAPIIGVPDRALGENMDCEDGDCTCTPDHADCNHDFTDGCETSLKDDGESCGSCGHSCLGGHCDNSGCEWLKTKLSVGDDVQGPFLVDGQLYLLTEGGTKILSAAVGTDTFSEVGTVPSSVATAAFGSAEGFYVALSNDDSSKVTVFRADGEEKVREIAAFDFLGNVSDLGVTSEGFYLGLTDQEPEAEAPVVLVRVDRVSGKEKEIDSFATGLGVFDDEYYWLDDDNLVQAEGKNGARKEPWKADLSGFCFTGIVTATYFYLSCDQDRLVQVDRASFKEGTVAVHATGFLDLQGTLYFLGVDDGSLERLDGDKAVTLGPALTLNVGARLVADKQALYWVDDTGIWRWALPLP